LGYLYKENNNKKDAIAYFEEFLRICEDQRLINGPKFRESYLYAKRFVKENSI